MKCVVRVILALLWLAVTIYALLDCIRTPSDNMPGKLPKILWILVILMLGVLGPIAWIIVSRVAAAEAKDGRIEPNVWSSDESMPLKFGKEKPKAQPHTPDDDPEFLEEVSRRLRDKQREEYQRKQREAEEKSRHQAPDSKGFTPNQESGNYPPNLDPDPEPDNKPNSGKNPDADLD